MKNSVALLLSFSLVCRLTAGPLELQSTETNTPLLELFTSEGCSSCPPAEEWLSKLKTAKDLWTDFVPVAFHVDYWDYLGWRDPFAKRSFSDRQRTYAAAWRSRSIYTPGFVWNGAEWKDWHGELRAPQKTKSGVLKATYDDGRINVSFDKPGAWEVHAAILGFGILVNVTTGENSGRKLAHDFVVLAHTTGALGSLELPLPAKSVAAKLALAVWVSPRGNPAPVQAVGGWLPR